MNAQELARRQKDVRLRSTLKDSQLTPDLLKKRLFARRLKQPVVPGSDSTYGDLLAARKAATDLQYAEPIGSLQAQIPRDAGWFDQYVQAVKAGQAAQQAQAADVAQQIQNFGNSGIQASQQLQAQTLAPLEQQAQLTGGTVDPNIASVGANASLVRQAMVNAFGANASANSQAQGDLLRAREQAGLQGKIEHGTDLQSKLQALLKEKGAYQNKFTTDYQDAARQAVLENQAFGLKQDQAAAAQANTDFDNQLASDKFAASQAKDDYQRSHGLGPYKPPAASKPEKTAHEWQSQIQQSGARSYVARTINLAKVLQGGKGVRNPNYNKNDPKSGPEWRIKPGKLNRHQAAELIINDPKAKDPALISAALDIVYDGKISRATLKKLHDAGYKVGPMGYPINKVMKAPSKPAPSQRPQASSRN